MCVGVLGGWGLGKLCARRHTRAHAYCTHTNYQLYYLGADSKPAYFYDIISENRSIWEWIQTQIVFQWAVSNDDPCQMVSDNGFIGKS